MRPRRGRAAAAPGRPRERRPPRLHTPHTQGLIAPPLIASGAEGVAGCFFTWTVEIHSSEGCRFHLYAYTKVAQPRTRAASRGDRETSLTIRVFEH